MTKSTKWYTCTPVAFKGDHTFFNRDSGLFCRAFQEIGIESKAVMPLPIQKGDESDLIRTDYKNLESADWWKSQNIDGVVLYAWGIAKYTPIAKAIHDSGAKLILYQDTGCSIYPWFDWRFNTKKILRKATYQFKSNKLLHGFCAIFHANIISPLNYFRRREHFNFGDLITFPFPKAAENYRKISLLLSRKVKKKSIVIPCPVASHFTYPLTVPKEPIVLAVGRWDDQEQKRPHYMMEAIEIASKQSQSTIFYIFGNTPDFIHCWHRNLPKTIQARINLMGIVPNVELINYYQKAQVILCPSMYESTHIVSAEGICCGCSVVVSPIPSLAAIHWYGSENSGTVSTTDTPESFADGILHELDLWSTEKRDPSRISQIWSDRLHATKSVKKIISHFTEKKEPLL